jgi:pyruvate/2-oxoglutarate dehydrogenase complex dihydrolipoamide dehydrogenase (E3) component
VVPPIDGLAGTPYWTNREAVKAAELPESLIVLGGGAIGLELAQAFRRFGVAVTVVRTRPSTGRSRTPYATSPHSLRALTWCGWGRSCVRE